MPILHPKTAYSQQDVMQIPSRTKKVQGERFLTLQTSIKTKSYWKYIYNMANVFHHLQYLKNKRKASPKAREALLMHFEEISPTLSMKTISPGLFPVVQHVQDSV